MKPKTGFELILNYSSHECPKKNLKNESSAGANAETSRINTAISATDPLSEIVWSPDKGFSLKCVDSSFTNKSTSLFRDVEPTSMVLALQQSVTCATDEPIDDVFVQPVAVICAKSDVSSTDIPARPPISESESADNSEKLKSDRGTQSSQDEEKSLTLAHENSDRCVLWPDKNVGTRMCHQVGESSKDDVGSYLPPQIRPINFLNSHEHLKNNTLELYERKEICHKSDTKEDLWLTRFSPKSTSPLMGFEAPSTYCSMLTHNHKHISHQNNCKVEKTRKQSTDNQLLIETEKLQNCCINKETSSIGVKDEKGNNDHISKHVTPFPRLRDSEPMVSMFAKRLGAIKQCKQTE